MSQKQHVQISRNFLYVLPVVSSNDSAICYTLLVLWMTSRFHTRVFDYGLFAPLCENMTSSTTPEVHNRMTEPRYR